MSRSATCTVRPGCLNQHCLPPLVICHNFFVRSAVLFLINLIFIINILSVSQCRHIRAYFMFGLNWILVFALRSMCLCVCIYAMDGQNIGTQLIKPTKTTVSHREVTKAKFICVQPLNFTIIRTFFVFRWKKNKSI